MKQPKIAYVIIYSDPMRECFWSEQEINDYAQWIRDVKNVDVFIENINFNKGAIAYTQDGKPVSDEDYSFNEWANDFIKQYNKNSYRTKPKTAYVIIYSSHMYDVGWSECEVNQYAYWLREEKGVEVEIKHRVHGVGAGSFTKDGNETEDAKYWYEEWADQF